MGRKERLHLSLQMPEEPTFCSHENRRKRKSKFKPLLYKELFYFNLYDHSHFKLLYAEKFLLNEKNVTKTVIKEEEKKDRRN